MQRSAFGRRCQPRSATTRTGIGVEVVAVIVLIVVFAQLASWPGVLTVQLVLAETDLPLAGTDRLLVGTDRLLAGEDHLPESTSQW